MGKTMLYSEFKKLTGAKVSIEEYDCIEQSYYDSELDKVELCKMWKQDYDSGKWAVELALRRRLRHMTEELKEREKKIAKLEERLEREQDWKLSDRAGTHMPQEKYIFLRKNSDNICYDTAKNIIAADVYGIGVSDNGVLECEVEKP